MTLSDHFLQQFQIFVIYWKSVSDLDMTGSWQGSKIRTDLNKPCANHCSLIKFCIIPRKHGNSVAWLVISRKTVGTTIITHQPTELAQFHTPVRQLCWGKIFIFATDTVGQNSTFVQRNAQTIPHVLKCNESWNNTLYVELGLSISVLWQKKDGCARKLQEISAKATVSKLLAHPAHT